MLLENWDDLDENEKSIYQSQIYQKKFQENLKKQIDGFMKELESQQYKSVDAYLKAAYETGYIGTMYDIAGQGIPLIMPIDQKAVVRAMTHDTKLSKRLYTKLGEDINLLKKRIANNISRGIATADSYINIARNIASGTNVGVNRTMTIARTESHRIQVLGAVDAQHKAKDAGADVVKQWDAALDGRTRPHHRQLDGQIRELDEPFEVDGMEVMYPSGFGKASEDINCRCALLQRAKWALDEEELETLKERAEYYGLDKSKDLEEFAKKYNIAIKKENEIPFDIRKLPEIEFDKTISGLNKLENATLKNAKPFVKSGTAYDLTISKKVGTAWDDASKQLQTKIKYSSPARNGKPIYMDANTYHVERYVEGEGSSELAERLEIARLSGSEYLGTTYFSKYKTLFDVDVYKKGDDIFYSMGKATVKSNISSQTLKTIEKTISEREKIIVDVLKKKHIQLKTVTERSGDDWVKSMKVFHNTIKADGLPKIVSNAEYDSIKSPVLYRGIAPQSRMRADITTTMSTREMADEFFKGTEPFPSRGIYGDGIAYASPSFKRIATQYATSGGTQPHGGVIIEFKLKPNAKIIEYDEALELFQQMSHRGDSKLLFNSNQRKASNSEVGKAMNALGYDAIIKHNGDNTGKDFYVILNRGALVTKEKYISKQF